MAAQNDSNLGHRHPLRVGRRTNDVFEAGYLDSGYRLLRDGIEKLEKGTIDRAAVCPRRVIEAALRNGAFGFDLACNHLNGEITPRES